MKDETKKVHFISLGCPKNLVDSEIMLGLLTQDGYEVVEQPEEADTVVVNTCGFIDDAKKESIQRILETAELKETGKLDKLVVAGCLTQRYKDELIKDLPEADLFVGSGQFQNLPAILREADQGVAKKDYFDRPTYLQEDSIPRINSQQKHTAYLKISEGCKKRCAFCSIPHIRGNLQSRTIDSVVNEAKLLVASGVQELNIISHDFTDYGWDLRKKSNLDDDPYRLLRALSDETSAKWLRVLYFYPDGINREFVELIQSRKNLLKYFDMPLQHINTDMLKAMNRRMTSDQIHTAVQTIREYAPDSIIRTQFIVGFPGETEEQFEEVLDFIETYKLDRVGCFKYSQEEGTKAATMANQVDEEVKQRRYDMLMQVQNEISRSKNELYIGKVLDVVVEGYSEESELLLKGRHSGQAPEIDGVTYITEGQADVGEFVKVEITDAHDYDLAGRIVR